MTKKDVDWHKLKEEYATTDISVRCLCNKYDLNQSTLSRHMAKEGWSKDKHEVVVQRRCETQIIKAYADTTNAELCARISNLMVTKTVEALELLDPRNTQGMKHLSGVIKDLKEVRMWKDDLDLDRKEQEARIKKLEREAEGEADNSVTINIVGADDYAG